jgi:hypothetical protein
VDSRANVRLPALNEIIGDAESNVGIYNNPHNKSTTYDVFYVLYHNRPYWVGTAGMPSRYCGRRNRIQLTRRLKQLHGTPMSVGKALSVDMFTYQIQLLLKKREKVITVKFY